MGLQWLLKGGDTRTVSDPPRQLIPDARSNHWKGSVAKFIQVKRRLIQFESVHCRSHGHVGLGHAYFWSLEERWSRCIKTSKGLLTCMVYGSINSNYCHAVYVTLMLCFIILSPPQSRPAILAYETVFWNQSINHIHVLMNSSLSDQLHIQSWLVNGL